MTVEFDPSDIPIEFLEMQRKMFREKFDHVPGPEDPIFFDPDANEPVKLDEGNMSSDMLKTLKAADARAQIICSYKRTGRIFF